MQRSFVRSAAIVVSLVFAAGCSTMGKNTAVGAGAGAAAGAALGGIIGYQSHKGAQGAVIGAAAGTALGAGVGYYLDKQKAELEKVAETKRTEEGLQVNLKSDILFDVNSAALKPEAQAQVAQLGGILSQHPENLVTVKGHADSTGEDKHNQKLSEQRADAVRLALVEKGVNSQTITAVGYGETAPVASNDTPEGRARNRRVELEIRVDESKLPK